MKLPRDVRRKTLENEIWEKFEGHFKETSIFLEKIREEEIWNETKYERKIPENDWGKKIMFV